MTRMTTPELRFAVTPITRVDVRDTSATDDNTWTMSGVAAVFDAETVIYDGRFMKIVESVDPGAFDTVMSEQMMDDPSGVVHFNFGHDMNRAVAATDVPAGQPGSLTLEVAEEGLRFMARVPRDDPDGIALASKMRTGVVRQASFAFTVAAGGWDTDEDEDEDTGKVTYNDTIMEVSHLYDVCACAQGAYSQTVSGLRAYALALGQPAGDPAGGRPRQPQRGEAGSLSARVREAAWTSDPGLARSIERARGFNTVKYGSEDVRHHHRRGA